MENSSSQSHLSHGLLLGEKVAWGPPACPAAAHDHTAAARVGACQGKSRPANLHTTFFSCIVLSPCHVFVELFLFQLPAAARVRSFSHFLFLRHRIICWPGPLPKGYRVAHASDLKFRFTVFCPPSVFSNERKSPQRGLGANT